MDYITEIGGHSSVWAKRAQIEGCKSYMTPYPSDFNKDRLVLSREEGKSTEDLLVLKGVDDAPEDVNKGKK